MLGALDEHYALKLASPALFGFMTEFLPCAAESRKVWIQLLALQEGLSPHARGSDLEAKPGVTSCVP